jgi:N-methylhydantoinase A/oxoprolinase/acetone carboxylase beta subunit
LHARTRFPALEPLDLDDGDGARGRVLGGVDTILAESGVAPSDLALVIHGTMLATNAIIERKGTKTALLVTSGFRDSVEMAYENRFEMAEAVGITHRANRE